MSNYTKTTNFATKDNLSPGNPLKIVKGTEIDTEFNNIQTAVGTKTDNASAAITGGSITGITDLAVADGGTGASTATAALNNLLPSQTGNANKYLQTDGTNATWDAVSLSTSDITGTLPVANGGTGVTTSTGTGNVVLSNSPTLVTPALGIPASGTATNLTGLPISTGVSGLGTGVATFLGTPSSANLASAVTDETGTGSLVFATSPTLVTPALGTPSALVGTNITGTASGLTAGNVTTNANLTGAVTSVGNATSLGSFSSSNLAGALTDETGSGSAVFATSPTLVTPILGTPTSATLTNATGLPISTGVSGLGTGVATALAVNVGSSGAPLVNGGVLGTPSSGTATNLTGLPISTGVSGLGTGVATALAVNVGSAGAAVVNGGALGTPSSGTATNLTGLPLSTGVTGTLPVANGGTGQTSYTDGQLLIGNSTGNTLTKATLTAGSGITVTNSAGGITIAASGGGGSGDVVGPSSSTDNAIVRFDGTTGKLVQNSAVTIADDGATVISTSSASDALRITQTGAGNAILVEDSANPDSTPFVVDATGNIISGATTGVASQRFRIVGSLTGGTTAQGSNNSATIQSDVTSAAYIYTSAPGTAAASFTLSALQHFRATQSTFGAGSAVTTQIGYAVESTLTGATNNYGFYGNIASGTNRFNLYMAGTADNYMAGSLGVGTTALTQFGLRVSKTITGNVSSYGIRSDGVVQSDVTTQAFNFNSTTSTAASSFTLGQMIHYGATQSSIGAGSTVTNQYGYLAESTLTGATNNYGFYGNIASGTGRYNLYMGGTADNYMAGSLGIGTTPATGVSLILGKSLTGATNAYVVQAFGIVQSDVTGAAWGVLSQLNTAATSFTTQTRLFQASQGSIGAGSTLSSQTGFYADSSLTGATNNYGFYSNIASGTGRWNFYAAGTASNYFAGKLGIGGTAARATTAGTAHLDLFDGTAPAGTLTNGVSLYSASGDLRFMDSAGNAYSVGYRNIPKSGSSKTSSYTLATSDVGEFIEVGTSGAIVVPDATFSTGDVVSIFNNTSGNITMTMSITTAYIGGTDSDKATITVATRGVATVLFISGTVCVVNGNVS